MNTISASISSRTIQQPRTTDDAEARRKANYEAFENMIKERVQQANAQAHEEYLSQQTGAVSAPVKLTEQQKQYLSAKYNAQDMSEEDFAAFVEDLYQYGLLSDRDKSILGYGEKDPLLAWRTGDSVARYEPGKTFDSFADCNGNVLAWAKYQASIQDFDPQAKKFYRSSTALLFDRLHSILQQISHSGSAYRTRAAQDRVDIRPAAERLSADELAGLASKYQPGHMTQEEYDAFLDELEEKGVLSKDDKMLVKNPNMRFGDVLVPHGIAPGGAYVEADPLTPPKSLLEYDGNATVYVKAMLAYELELAERVSPCKEDRQRIEALRKVSDILAGMGN